MTKQVRTQLIYQKLEEYLKPKGFTLVGRLNQFRKTSSIGFQTVIVSLSHYDDLSILEVHLGVRNDLIEKMAFQFTNGSPIYREDSLTLVASVGKLQGKRWLRHEIQSGQDLTTALQQTLLFLEQKGLAWLERHQKTNVIDHVLNEDPFERTLLMPNQIHRCYRGLVAAKMNHREGFSLLVNAYRTLLDELLAPEYQKEVFERLRVFLEEYSVN